MTNNVKTCTCWFCGSPLAWIGDYPYDEVFEFGDGIVAKLVCSECGANATFSIVDEESLYD